MAVKIADTIKPMGNFPIGECVDINVNINGETKRLQKAIDDGEIGCGSDSTWKGTREEWEALSTEEKGKYKVVYFTDDYDSSEIAESDSIWQGTKEEWEALSTEEKGKYKVICFTNDYDGRLIDDSIISNKTTYSSTKIEEKFDTIKDKINNVKLTELNDVDNTDIGNGKTLVYDGTTKKHKYVDSTGTDELVKMDSTTDAKHLSELIDKSTIVNDNGVLKVKQLDGQQVTIAEINRLKGLTMNVMDLVNVFANGGVKVLNTPVATYADLSTLDRSTFLDDISYIVYVLADETHSGAKTTYLCDKTSETFFGNADSQRNFITNPIDLGNEVIGKLGASNIDVDALWNLLTINDTYKTLTTKNEPFGTHGAKALYDELVANKGNTTDLTTHTSDTDIHITTAERTKWNTVIDKASKSDLTKHTGDTNIHVTTAERTKWNEVDNKVDKTSIVTTIDTTSTDSDVPSAKAVYKTIPNIWKGTLAEFNTAKANGKIVPGMVVYITNDNTVFDSQDLYDVNMEIETNKCFLGKTVYRRMFAITSMSSSSSKSYSINNLEEIVSISGKFRRSTYNYPIPYHAYNSTTDVVSTYCSLGTSTSTVYLYTGSSASIDSGYLIVEYTKF